jgi:hypothetical protein
MGNSPSTPTTKTLKNNEHPYLGFNEQNIPILSEQKIPERKEKPLRKEKPEKKMKEKRRKNINDIKDEYAQIKNECPPCPKYNFEGSYEESQMKKKLKKTLDVALGNYLKLEGNKTTLLKQIINELINSKDKSPIDDISFEILIEKDVIINVIDQEMINNINKKGSPKQIKALSESQKLNKKFKTQISDKEPQKQEIILLESQKIDDMHTETTEQQKIVEEQLTPNTENKMKYFKYKEKYLKLKYN